MQIDIETTTLSPSDPRARVLMISASDSCNRTEQYVGGETTIISKLAELVISWDPDIIEGHNIFSFDLPYLMERCRSLGVPFILGRDIKSSPSIGQPRNCAIGALNRPFTPIFIYGRHVIDTYLQVQRFDAPADRFPPMV